MNGTVRKIIMIIAASVFLFSSVMVWNYYSQMRAGAELAEAISEMAVVLPTEPVESQFVDDADKETTEPEETENLEELPKKESVTAPIQVDFELLLSKNQDVIGWLYCADTRINYPVVQASDNKAYLHHLLDGRYNAAGTLFMDCRNASDLSDWNSVIYGHNMNNKSMFGTLTNYKKQAYFEAHPEMYFLTPEKNYKIQLVAGFVTKANSDVYSEFNPDEEEKESLMNSWLEASKFDAELELKSDYRLITLSTCSYEFKNARFVVIGVLEEL